MLGTLLKWSINTWLSVTGKKVLLDDEPWLDGPMSESDTVGDKYYQTYADKSGLLIDQRPDAGLISDFSIVIPDSDPLKKMLKPSIAHFYEHTRKYKLEVWSQWYSPMSLFSKLLIKSLSAKMDQLNIPLEPLETSRGMTNDVIPLRDPKTNEVKFTCWLRRTISTGRVVYAGFYSASYYKGQPFVKVVFPLPKGNVTVVLRAEVQPDGSIKLISKGKGIGGAGYYRVQKSKGRTVKVRYVPLKECIHVYEDEEGVLRTDHEFAFWGMKLLHLHYKMVLRNSPPENKGTQL